MREILELRELFEKLEARVTRLEDRGTAPTQSRSAFTDKVTEAMKAQAFIFAKDPKCQDGWKGFLRDMQGMTSFSDKQMKLYKVIHKQLTGQWPDAGPIATPPVSALSDDDIAGMF